MLTAMTTEDGEERVTAAAAPTAPHASKSEFVLGLPRELGAREVVARAKERGITISEPYVYQVRYDAMAAPEPASPVTAQAQDGSKEAFISSLPPEVPYAEAPATAKDARILLFPGMVARPPTTLEPSTESAMLTAMTTEDGEGEASAAEAPKAPPPSKSEFIRGLPRDLSAGEVVALGKEQGLTFTTHYVRDVRSGARARGMRVARPVPAALASATPAPQVPAPLKADFVRSLPAVVSYAEAATKAKAAGILLSPSYFYTLRSQAKLGAAAAAPKSKPVRSPTKQVTPARALEGLRLASDDAREQALIDVVRALGVSRA